MAKGYARNRERQEALTGLGKELARRARSHCELCDASGTRLNAWEVAPIAAEADVERTLLLCDRCMAELEQLQGRRWQVSEHWRSLSYGLWSQTPAAQVMSVRILQKLAEQAPWAADMLETAYLDEAVEAWVAEATLTD